MGREMDDDEWNEETEQTTVKKRASHIRFCCADGCSSKGYRLLIAGERVQYFPFPLFDKALCSRWAAAIKLSPNIAFEKAFVCSKHFRQGDYKMKIGEDNKKSLRRTAIPSLEPVVHTGKGRKVLQESLSDDSSTDEDEANLKELTSIVSRESADGENLTLVVLKDMFGSDLEDGDLGDNAKLKLLSKKVPLRCEQILAMGPPFPWKGQDLGVWAKERLTAHEEQLQKTRESIDVEEQKCRVLEEKIDQLNEILAHLILKNHMGRLTVIQHFKKLIA